MRGKVGKKTKIIRNRILLPTCLLISWSTDYGMMYVCMYVCMFVSLFSFPFSHVTFLFLEGVKVAGMQISHRLIT